MRTGIALSSGGVRGVYAHTGFMRVIEESSIAVSAITGCSAGAIVGGILASGTPLAQWEETMLKLDPKDFWHPPPLSKLVLSHLLDKGRGYVGLSTTEAALEFTQSNLAVSDFSQCTVPFHSLAINVGTLEKTIFSTGTLAPRIVASATIPILYEPIEIDHAFYCDGALIEFAPTEAICCRHQLDLVIVHHVSQSHAAIDDFSQFKNRSWPLLELINRLMFRQRPWYLDGSGISIRHCPCRCGAIILALEPSLPELPWPGTQGSIEIAASAEQQARETLSFLFETIKEGDLESLHQLANGEAIPTAPAPCSDP